MTSNNTWQWVNGWMTTGLCKMAKKCNIKMFVYLVSLDQSMNVFLNTFAKGLAKLLLKTLCDGIMNKDMNK